MCPEMTVAVTWSMAVRAAALAMETSGWIQRRAGGGRHSPAHETETGTRDGQDGFPLWGGRAAVWWECFSRDGDRSRSFPAYVDSRRPLSFVAVKSQGDLAAPGRPSHPARLPSPWKKLRLFLEQSFLDNGQEQTPPHPQALWLSGFQTQLGHSGFG